MSITQLVETSNEQMTAQNVYAIEMLNRLRVAQIRLKRADRLSTSFIQDMNEIREAIHSLSDSLLLGEDVKSDLKLIDNRLTIFESTLAT